jgi:TonB-dependent receptor-like protein
VINPSNQVAARFNLISARAENVNGGPNRSLGSQRAQIDEVQGAIVTHNLVLGRKVNEFRFNYSRDNQPTVRHPLGTDFPTAVVNVDGQNLTIGGEGTDLDPFFQYRTQIIDNLSYLLAKHDLKFGVDINLTRVDEFFAIALRGQYTFLSLADFLARKPASFAQFVPLHGLTSQAAGSIQPAYKEFALFAQDKYRVNSQLTINYGLRWEAQVNKDATTNPDFPLSGPIPDQWKNFAPRFGVSWDPSQRGTTVVRAGAGIFYARSDGIDTVRVFDTNGTKAANISLTPAGPGGNLIPVFPQRFTSFDQLPPNAIPPLNITYADSSFQLPRSEQWTAGIEHEIVPNLALSVDFEFANTYHGNEFRNVNMFPSTRTDADGRPLYDLTRRPYPQFNRIQAIESTSRATYRALSVSLEKRYSKRLQVQGSYTYAKAMDDAGDSFNRVQGLVLQDSFSLDGEFGPSARDIRHRVVASSVLDLPLGFTVSQILSWQSGLPFNATLARDANGDGVFTDRPYVNGHPIQRNSYRQPAYGDWDLRILKKLSMGALRGHTELSLEIFNLTNASNFTTTNTIFGAPTFGGLNVPGTPFQMQVSVRHRF